MSDTFSDPLDLVPDSAPEPAPFDASSLTPSDVPIVPDHTASEGEAPELPDAGGHKNRGARFKRDKVRKPPPPKQRPGALVRPLTDLYTSVGTMIVPFDPMCGSAVIDNAKKCAETLDALARENDAVRRALMAMTQTSAWGGVLIAHLPLLLMVMAHHGPQDVAEKVGPLAAMMNPNTMAAHAVPPQGKDAA